MWVFLHIAGENVHWHTHRICHQSNLHLSCLPHLHQNQFLHDDHQNEYFIGTITAISIIINIFGDCYFYDFSDDVRNFIDDYF